MSLTPRTIRTDLKCGKGSISQGEKCTKGTAQALSKTAKLRSTLENAAIAGSAVGTAVSSAQVAFKTATGDLNGASKALQRQAAFSGIMGSAMIAKGKRERNTQLIKKGLTNLQLGLVAGGIGHFSGGGYTKNFNLKEQKSKLLAKSQKAAANVSALKGRVFTQRKQRSQLERMFQGPSAKRDSVWADGFPPEIE